MVVQGGRDGLGNNFNRQAGDGLPGEEKELVFDLKLIADIGVVGFPNAGKSTLISAISNAHSEIAAYPFTTKFPVLGVIKSARRSLVIADIPGLIEGASTGKGLGITFLKHVERTKVLFHLIAADSQNPLQDYKTVRQELELYNPLLLEKPEHIFLSKSDAVTAEKINDVKREFKKIDKETAEISIINPVSMVSVKKILNTLIEEKTAQTIDL